MNQSNRLLDEKCLSKGGINQTVVDIRLALKPAIELGATPNDFSVYLSF